MTSDLVYVGLTHQTTPLAIRENLRVDGEKLRTLLSRLGGVADGRLVLATCERFEVYATTRHLEVESWVGMLSQWFHVPTGLLASHVRGLRGVGAAEHLLRVAAGLESRIVGEAQILGQVRDSYTSALEMNALDAQLSTLGRTAIRAGKRVRSETTLGEGTGSIATVVLDALLNKSVESGNPSVAVVGTGRLAEVVLAELVRRGVRDRTVVGRDVARAADLAARFEAAAGSMEKLRDAAMNADAIIVCTAAPTYVLDAAAFGDGRRRPVSVFDLSVPRNVDPLVGRIANVRLTHLDELVLAEGATFSSEAEGASRIVGEELERFVCWRRERGAAEAIARLVRGARSFDRHRLHQEIQRLKAEASA